MVSETEGGQGVLRESFRARLGVAFVVATLAGSFSLPLTRASWIVAVIVMLVYFLVMYDQAKEESYVLEFADSVTPP